MTTNRHTLDKFWITFGKLILVDVCTVLWCIFLIVKKQQSYIIAGISVLIYLIYLVANIVLMVKWEEERIDFMPVITMEDIIESNRLKTNTLEAVKNDMKGILSKSQLEKLEQAFMSVTEGCLFKMEEE